MRWMRIGIGVVVAVGLVGYFTLNEWDFGPAKPTAPESVPMSRDEPGPPVLPPPATPSTPVDPAVETAVRDRVTAYWAERSRSNLLGAYPFYDPAFRAKYSADQFLDTFQRLLRFRPKFQGIERVDFEADGRAARVAVRLRTRPEVLLGEELDSITDETWRLADGVWCKEGEALLPAF
jgi:hypothetical protein